MNYHLKFSSKRVEKARIRLLPEKDRASIFVALGKLLQDPFRADLDVVRLTDRRDWRLRVGSWRVTYLVDTDQRQLVVTGVDNRRDAYKR